MSTSVHCTACDSTNTAPYGQIDDIYECLECGEIFEDDAFVLKQIRNKYHKQEDPSLDEHG